MSDEDWIILEETFQCCEKMVVKKESCQWTELFYLECVVACWVENNKTKAGLTLLSPWLTVRLFQYWVGEQGQGRLALAALPGLGWRRSACPLGLAATNHQVSILSHWNQNQAKISCLLPCSKNNKIGLSIFVSWKFYFHIVKSILVHQKYFVSGTLFNEALVLLRINQISE